MLHYYKYIDTFGYLDKKQMAELDGGLMKVIYGIVAVVILFTAAPELWTILNNALGNISTAGIPLVSGMTGIVGLVFGAVILIGGLFYLFKLFKGSNR